MKLSIFFKLILVFFAYFILGELGLSLATINASATPIWAPTGIAIASMLIFGKKIWPVIFVAAFFTNLATTGAIASSVGIAIGNTLEGLIGAYLIFVLAGGLAVFDSPRNIFKFVIIVFVSAMISATWGVSSLLLNNLLFSSEAASVWITWWLGDVSGAILLTPLIIIWFKKRSYQWNKDKQLEAIILFLILVIVSGAVFNGLFLDIKQSLPLEFLCIPFLVWIALRFDQRLTSASLVFLAVIGIWGTVHGLGSFSQYSQGESLLLLQSFLSVTTITIIALSAVVREERIVKERFQRTLDNMSEGFQIIGFDMRYLYANDAVLIQGKRKKEELLGKTMMEVYPGIENTEFFNYFKKAMHERIPHTMENKFDFPDGSSGWFSLKIEPISEGVLILSVDITEQKKDQMEIAKEKAEAEALLDSIGDGIIATNAEGKVMMINHAFEEMLGFSESELLGVLSFDKLLMEDERKNILPEEDRPHSMALRTGKKITVTHYLVRKNGTKFLARVTASPILLDKKVVGAVKVFHDITAEREIDNMKNEFISMASHELRTPLSIIKGFVSMINSGDYGVVENSFQKPLQHITSSTERLIKMVNEMLDVSRIDVSRVELSMETLSLKELVDESVSGLKNLARGKGLELNAINFKPVKVLGDREKIINILKNIIENAIKYTEKGSVELRVVEKGSKAFVEIADTGVGIAKNDQNKLFNKFEQIKSKKAGGTGIGLGLYISREMARKMNGDLWIRKSEIGKGSTFAFSVLVARAGQSNRKQPK